MSVSTEFWKARTCGTRSGTLTAPASRIARMMRAVGSTWAMAPSAPTPVRAASSAQLSSRLAESSRTRTITAVDVIATSDSVAVPSRLAYGTLSKVSGSPESRVRKTPRAAAATANGVVPRAAANSSTAARSAPDATPRTVSPRPLSFGGRGRSVGTGTADGTPSR